MQTDRMAKLGTLLLGLATLVVALVMLAWSLQ